MHSHDRPPSLSPPAYATTSDQSPAGGPSALPSECEKPGYYVHYRIYTLDGAITAQTAFDSGNPFVGRVKTNSVPPPHNALSIKRRLGEVEGFPDPNGTRTRLYASCAAPSSLENGELVAQLGHGVGATPETALGLVVIDDGLSTKDRELVTLLDVGVLNYQPEYVYYRLHTISGPRSSAQRFDESEPELGRIDRLSIAPPRDIQSFKRCVARAEQKRIYAYADLYGDVLEETPWPNNRPLVPVASIFTDLQALERSLTLTNTKLLYAAYSAVSDEIVSPNYRPGSITRAPPDVSSANRTLSSHSAGTSPDTPFLLVQPRREEGLHNRPLKIVTPQTSSWVSFWNTQKWFSVSAGDVVMTDGVVKNINRRGDGVTTEEQGYLCTQANGKKGWILTQGTEFIDVD
ncbi:hypothetical protein C8F01DRAFT_1013107 [Mycena amicta]|nr:hypothetical protein C8F01DRAFT_1013107 [Mycena amicta]